MPQLPILKTNRAGKSVGWRRGFVVGLQPADEFPVDHELAGSDGTLYEQSTEVN